MKFPLPRIHHNFDGFNALAMLYAQTEEYVFEDIEIDMRATDWFDADMCAVFGAILHRLLTRLNTVELTHIPPDVEDILSKNRFLSHYGGATIPDRWGATIAYRRFDIMDDQDFVNYVERELIQRSEIPNMSSGFLGKFRSSIHEIFNNAVFHSRTQLGIFSCGQFFPNKETLDFTVADLGVGIRQNIKDLIERDMSSEEAISWATEEANTTKRDKLPGGLGLKVLRDFIAENGGCLQIVSDAGYWRQQGGSTLTATLSNAFPGTVISVEINTADESIYQLRSELINPYNIF